jgi:hypothetical protein
MSPIRTPGLPGCRASVAHFGRTLCVTRTEDWQRNTMGRPGPRGRSGGAGRRARAGAYHGCLAGSAPDDPAGTEHHRPATPEPRREPTIWDPEVERLEETECWRLISAGGVGRLAYSGRSGLAVLPVGYQVQEGSLVFRIALGSPTDEDLRTGIEGAEYKVAVEIDDVGHGRARRLVRFHAGCRPPPGFRPRSHIARAAGRPATAGRYVGGLRAHHTHVHRRPPPAPPLTSRQHRQFLPALRPELRTQHRAAGGRPLSWKAAAPHHVPLLGSMRAGQN